ncbi:outer membrane protein [Kordiimonas sp. SCSIO 12610]|uniref:outer membrane protein n=1 Tax=Kordiimonas sp. SCSIO 12610 TaxID=2829597 RepID=UPI00210B251B|nr:outer membrane beta-barrel protein [Kordiimonas sp. SCSIO 12610]UTW56599.1 porin family protein [Kordiimonas sp. SCSIO 12610]
MKLINTFTTAIIGATLISGIAVAQQDDKKFDGAYVGAEIGVDWLRFNDSATTNLGITDNSERGFYYGGVLGFRTQYDNGLVLGLEGTFGDQDTNFVAPGGTLSTDNEWSASLILGQAFGDDGNNLIYGKAGYASLRGEFTPTTGAIINDNDGGWRFGVGYERALSKSISLRTGVDYTTYGNGLTQWQGKAGLLFKF